MRFSVEPLCLGDLTTLTVIDWAAFRGQPWHNQTPDPAKAVAAPLRGCSTAKNIKYDHRARPQVDEGDSTISGCIDRKDGINLRSYFRHGLCSSVVFRRVVNDWGQACVVALFIVAGAVWHVNQGFTLKAHFIM